MPAKQCLAYVTALLVPSLAQAIVIDDFTEGPLLLRSHSRPTFDATQEHLNPAHTVGGVRRWTRFYNNISDADVSPDKYSQIQVDPAEGVFDFRSVDTSRQIRGYFNLTYGDPDAPLAVDLTDGGTADRLRLRFVGELSSPWVQIGVRAPRLDGTGTGSISWSLLSPQVVVSSDPIFDLPYPNNHNGLDLTQVESIELYVYRYFAGDYFKLDLIETAGTPLTGDFNRDGDVNHDDYEAWAANKPLLRRAYLTGELVANESAQGRYLSVDGNADGYIDAADYTVWRDAYDAQQAALATPEPAVVSLAAIGASLMAFQRRQPC
jgi:hypothetical protein